MQQICVHLRLSAVFYILNNDYIRYRLFREEVKRVAFGLDIFGWVKNLEDGRVETTIQILQSVKDDTGEMKSSLARIEGDVKDTKFSQEVMRAA